MREKFNLFVPIIILLLLAGIIVFWAVMLTLKVNSMVQVVNNLAFQNNENREAIMQIVQALNYDKNNTQLDTQK